MRLSDWSPRLALYLLLGVCLVSLHELTYWKLEALKTQAVQRQEAQQLQHFLEGLQTTFMQEHALNLVQEEALDKLRRRISIAEKALGIK